MPDRPRPKFTVADALRGLFHEAGAQDHYMCNGDKAALYFDGDHVAPLAATRDRSRVSVLRSVVDIPEAYELYGIVEVTDLDVGAAVYGLSRIAKARQDHSEWYSPITKRIAIIRPQAEGYATSSELPWRVSFLQGADSGHMAIEYRGGHHIDLIAAPPNGDELLTDLPENYWLPDPSELVELIIPPSK
ncbi:MAG TPA: hypothetical protein VLA92_00510 [Candidatus Saccharimonadales bacterium]|nr:hypothetical protein [Candidatus Saccharimonadales bacterium]